MGELSRFEEPTMRWIKNPLMVDLTAVLRPYSEIKTLLKESPHIHVHNSVRVIAPEHWTQDKAVGGGRILGECCHFIDLCRYLQGTIVDWSRSTLKA